MFAAFGVPVEMEVQGFAMQIVAFHKGLQISSESLVICCFGFVAAVRFSAAHGFHSRKVRETLKFPTPQTTATNQSLRHRLHARSSAGFGSALPPCSLDYFLTGSVSLGLRVSKA